jgi:hypothetical protein
VQVVLCAETCAAVRQRREVLSLLAFQYKSTNTDTDAETSAMPPVKPQSYSQVNSRSGTWSIHHVRED